MKPEVKFARSEISQRFKIMKYLHDFSLRQERNTPEVKLTKTLHCFDFIILKSFVFFETIAFLLAAFTIFVILFHKNLSGIQ